MANETSIGLKIEIPNKTQFKKDLAEIDMAFKVNRSEIAKVTAEYGKNDKSMQALSARNESLQKAVDTQAKKVETLRAALSESAKEFGESDKRTMQWQTQLNNAEATLIKMNKQLDENRQAMEDAASNTQMTQQQLEAYRDSVLKSETSLATLGTKMEVVNSQYEQSDKSIESLSARSEILNALITEQKNKLENLNSALTLANREFGEGSDKSHELQQSVNKATAELNRMESELKSNEEAMGTAGKKTSSMGDMVRKLADVAGLDIPPVLDGMVNKLDGVSKSGAAVVAIVSSIVVGLSKMTIAAAENAKEVINLSQVMGMTTDEYQEWDFIMSRFGSSAEQMQGDLSQLAEKAMDAAAGAGEGAELFDKLGVKVTTGGGKLKSQSQIFDEVISKLQRMGNETERNAIASALLSTTGEMLVPVLNMNSKELENLKNQAHEMGAVMGKETLDKFGELNQSMQNFSVATSVLKNNLGEVLLPILTELFKAISAIPAPILQTILIITGSITVLVLLVKSIKEVTETGSTVKKFFTGFDFAANKTKLIILGVVAALAMLAIAIAHITGKGDGLQESLNTVNSTIGGISNPSVSTRGATQRIPAYAKGGVHSGGPAIVNDGPGYPGEIIDLPNGSRIYPHGTTPQGGGDTYNITIEARTIQEFNDIMRIVKGQRRRLVQGV